MASDRSMLDRPSSLSVPLSLFSFSLVRSSLCCLVSRRRSISLARAFIRPSCGYPERV